MWFSQTTLRNILCQCFNIKQFVFTLVSKYPSQQAAATFSQLEHPKKGFGTVFTDVSKMVGLRWQFVPLIKLKDGTKVDGIIGGMSSCLLLCFGLAHGFESTKQIPLIFGWWCERWPQNAVAQMCVATVIIFLTWFAEDAERCLAVDKVQAIVGNEDGVVLQLETSFSKGQVHATRPPWRTFLMVPIWN